MWQEAEPTTALGGVWHRLRGIAGVNGSTIFQRRKCPATDAIRVQLEISGVMSHEAALLPMAFGAADALKAWLARTPRSEDRALSINMK